MTTLTPQKRLLFVCVGNANRSQMAQALARIHGGDLARQIGGYPNPSFFDRCDLRQNSSRA